VREQRVRRRHPTGQIPEESTEAHQPRRDFTRVVHRIIDRFWWSLVAIVALRFGCTCVLQLHSVWSDEASVLAHQGCPGGARNVQLLLKWLLRPGHVSVDGLGCAWSGTFWPKTGLRPPVLSGSTLLTSSGVWAAGGREDPGR